MSAESGIIQVGSVRQSVRTVEGRRAMEWVTREHPRTDRVACPWLIRKFIDADATIVYVAPDQVLAYAERTGATSFDAPGARYTHRDGKCSFETLIEEPTIPPFPATWAAPSRLILVLTGYIRPNEAAYPLD